MAGFSWSMLLSILTSILGPLIGGLTPALKALLSDFLTDLYKKALATSNPWDDFAIGLLLDILGIPRPPPVS